ncbi:hypothetical protein H4R35_004971 [Dimargaris xerosporica]|nr:hypothetical protein H4R35_004971 [Dimargaris xerosporica]
MATPAQSSAVTNSLLQMLRQSARAPRTASKRTMSVDPAFVPANQDCQLASSSLKTSRQQSPRPPPAATAPVPQRTSPPTGSSAPSIPSHMSVLPTADASSAAGISIDCSAVTFHTGQSYPQLVAGPSLPCSPISLVPFDDTLHTGNILAVSDDFICYPVRTSLRLSTSLTDMSFSPGGESIFLGNDLGQVHCYDMRQKATQLILHGTPSNSPISFVQMVKVASSNASGPSNQLPRHWLITGTHQNTVVQLWAWTSRPHHHLTFRFTTDKPLASTRKPFVTLRYDTIANTLLMGHSERKTALFLKMAASHDGRCSLVERMVQSQAILDATFRAGTSYAQPLLSFGNTTICEGPTGDHTMQHFDFYCVQSQSVQLYQLPAAGLYSQPPHASTLLPRWSQLYLEQASFEVMPPLVPNGSVGSNAYRAAAAKVELPASSSQPLHAPGPPESGSPKAVGLSKPVNAIWDQLPPQRTNRAQPAELVDVADQVLKAVHHAMHSQLEPTVRDTVTQTLRSTVAAHLNRVLRDECQDSVQAIVQQTAKLAAEKVVCSPALAQMVADSVQLTVQQTMNELFASVLVPAYERSTAEMFRQMHHTFTTGVDQIISAQRPIVYTSAAMETPATTKPNSNSECTLPPNPSTPSMFTFP